MNGLVSHGRNPENLIHELLFSVVSVYSVVSVIRALPPAGQPKC